MTAAGTGRTILVSLEDAAAARVMRSVLYHLREQFEFFFLFSHPGLADVLGGNGLAYSCDAQACLLNAERFGLFLTFDSLRNGGAGSTSSWLASCFEEIGVPTIELQRHLFQLGCFPLGQGRAGAAQSPEGETVLWHYAARRVLEWGGAEGIGYPSMPFAGYELPEQADLICVTSALDDAYVTEKERYQFTVATIRTAALHPELIFCWALRGEEQHHEQAAPQLAMVSDANLPNLWLETRESARSVIRRARLGIAMPSTALLDYQQEGKSVVLFRGGPYAALEGSTAQDGFTNHFELEAQLAAARARPDQFRVSMSIGEFQPEKLRRHLANALETTSLISDWFERAGRYLVHVQRSTSPIQGSSKQVGANGVNGNPIMEKLNDISVRLGVIQRSTIAYKTLKVMKRIKGEG